jgi:hypothetical protein
VLKQGREEACAAVLELGLSARRRSAGLASTESNRRGLGAGGEGRGAGVEGAESAREREEQR